jgi:hypothetical protein
MSRPNFVLIFDIDEILSIEDPLLNIAFIQFLKSWYERTPAKIELHIMTSRRASFYENITRKQLSPIHHYIEKYHFLPEDLPTTPKYIQPWKNDRFDWICHCNAWDKIIIVERDINLLIALTFHIKMMEFWIFHDACLLKCHELTSFIQMERV